MSENFSPDTSVTNLNLTLMKKTMKIWALLLSGAMLTPCLASANPEENRTPEAEAVAVEAPAVEKEKTPW